MNRSASATFLTLIVSFMLFISSSSALGQAPRSASDAAEPPVPENTLVVTTTADSGAGSLRQALIDATADDTITFDTFVFPPASPATISLQSELPNIYQGNITLDASNAGVVLDGQNIPPGYFRCLVVSSNGNTIRGFQIVNCRFDGILLANASNNVIGGDRGVGSGPLGQGNLISGTGGHGIQIYSDSRNNRVSGNLIGTDLAGTGARPNNYSGIAIQGAPGPSGNTIGGATPGERNIISGNRENGIALSDSAHDNIVIGNYIGVNITGSVDLGNSGSGIALVAGATRNTIGGNAIGERNIIGGNGAEGILIAFGSTTHNSVKGNFIGTNASGTAAISNDGGGIDLHYSGYNIIGGTNATPSEACTGDCNLISGNMGDNGISIFDTGAVSNTVTGNYIGTNFAGTLSLPNTNSGILVRTDAHHNRIGGATPGERNVISGNGGHGITIHDVGASDNVVMGNYIGVDASGTTTLGNAGAGVSIRSGASLNAIGGANGTPGGACTGECNVISGNGADGVAIRDSGTMTNTISGNYIGTDVTGATALGNGEWDDGVGIRNGPAYNIVGGDTPGERNVISGNGDNGFKVDSASHNILIGSYIGTDATGTKALGNREDGVAIQGDARDNQVEGNLISGNGEAGVNLRAGSASTTVSASTIGTDASGTKPLGNQRSGVLIDSTADNRIGGGAPGQGNLVSANGDGGVYIHGDGATGNIVAGNLIGTDASGNAELGNARYGVILFSGPQYNTIGGSSASERNIISGQEWEGVRIHRASQNAVIGNYIGTDAIGQAAIGNQRGVFLWGATNNQIGGTNPGEGNLVSGNLDNGITVQAETGLRTMPDLAGRSPDYTGVFPVIDFPDTEEPFASRDGITPTTDQGAPFLDLFAARFTGTLHVSAAGDYQLSLGSDDGSLLYLSDSLVIDRNYDTGFGMSYATVNLNPGSYPIRVEFFESYGTAGLFFGGNGPAPINLTTDGTTPGLRGELFLVSDAEQVIPSSDNVIVGNYVGTDAAGTSPLGNGDPGIYVWRSHNNRIGGPTDTERNVISYNGSSGVQINGAGSDDNVIQNNWIGIDADGTGGLDPRDLVVTEDGTVFLANYGRGVFKSTDKATSWQAANTGLATTKVEVLAASPDFATDGTAWAWGEGQLYITADRGAHWSAKSGALTAGLLALEISPDYTADKTLLAAVSGQGIYRSTDGGGNWTRVYVSTAVGSIAFSPGFATDRLALAGTMTSGVRRSMDGGATWADAVSGLSNVPVYDIAFADDGQTVLLASHKCGNEGVYRSLDAGLTWTGSGDGLNDCGSEWQIALSPDFASDGVALAAEDSPYRSADGGHTWSRSSGSFGSRGLALAFSPDFTSDGIAYLATFAGTFKTIDGGIHWIWAGGNLADRGNGGSGMEVCCGAGPSQILDNVIGRNAGEGIAIRKRGGRGTLIDSNLVGLGFDGVTRAANGGTNIRIETPYVVIRDNTSAAGSHGGLRSSQIAHHLTIEDNRFGTDATGTVAIGNSYDGMTLESSWDTVRRNVASGNLGAGVYASENMTGTHHSVFAGNLIGVDATGTVAVPNQSYGLAINGSYHTVGGTSPEDRNIISGNRSVGLRLFNGAHHNTVTGNYIGTDITSLNAIPNVGPGLNMTGGASDNKIGGAIPGRANLIAHNQYGGVRVWDSNSVRNTVSRNSIHSNTLLGIDLLSGGNTELPAPMVDFQDMAGGRASGTACPSCVVEIFSDDAGEGRTYETSATADAGGHWSVAKGAAFAGPELTATATDPAGNTSEFGQDWPGAPPPAPFVAAPVCGVTNQTQPQFSGLAQLGSTVSLAAGALLLGQTTADNMNHWSFRPGSLLADATHEIKATTTTAYGTSPQATLVLTVNSGLCYDPVGVTFTQGGVTQHPRNAAGCATPGNTLSVTLWPDELVTVSAPLSPSATGAFVEVNSVRYDLEDPNADGIYTTVFPAPASGSQVIVLAVGCGTMQQTMQIGSTIDPDGHVYDSKTNQAVSGATVTLYVRDTARSRWVRWDTTLYGQVNPQVTGPDGYFAFFTPPGQFKLLVDAKAQGYRLYERPNAHGGQ